VPALRNRHFFLVDLIALPLAILLAFVLRLDAVGLQDYLPAILATIVVGVPIYLLIFRRMGLYSRYWRYASVDELLQIALAVGLGTLLVAILLLGVALPSGLINCPRSIPFISGPLILLGVGGSRFTVRLLEQYRRERQRQQPGKRILIVGAGDAGSMIVKEMRANPQLGMIPWGFVDDDRKKHGIRIHGIPVLGGRDHIPEMVKKYKIDEVVIAMPTAPGTVIRDVLETCQKAGIPARTVPGMYDILSGQVSIRQIRDIDIEDLLRREPVHTDITAVEQMLRDCRVLITGAGGSIGSELCRQIARCAPRSLILVGHGENSIFTIANELQRLWPELVFYKIIADVRDLSRMHQVFETYRPQIVFHAAAHKHVPLMEENVAEAITNNVQGTANLLRLAESFRVERFVLISTDKAVNPTSVMGASKRVAELLVQEAARRSNRTYVAVRFGNVLGSRGSVVPLFREQIAHGGPLTVTHPEVRRYFMTIPEAVQLVLQAAALGQGGEVFLLDMGEPIRIVDLARDLIELSGLQEGRDIDIVFTGLRPGEKLFEELFVEGEEYVPTHHEKIFISRNGSQDSHYPVDLDKAVAELIELAHQGQDTLIREALRQIVPEYTPAVGSSPTEQAQEEC